MSLLTINPFTWPNYHRQGATAKLRIFAEETFFTSDGVQIIGQGSHTHNFYKEIACDVVGNAVSVPSFTLDTTTDSLDKPVTARYTGILYDARGEEVEIVFENWRVPHTLTSPTDWASLKIANGGVVNPYLDNRVYTKSEIDYLLAQIWAQIGLPDTIAPSIPGNFNMTGGAGQFTFDWTASTDTGGSGIQQYEIELTYP